MDSTNSRKRGTICVIVGGVFAVIALSYLVRTLALLAAGADSAYATGSAFGVLLTGAVAFFLIRGGIALRRTSSQTQD